MVNNTLKQENHKIINFLKTQPKRRPNHISCQHKLTKTKINAEQKINKLVAKHFILFYFIIKYINLFIIYY